MNRADAKRAASQIRRILKDDWDPIGFWTPDDEYDDFVWRLFGCRIEGETREAIAQKLQTWSDVVLKCPVAPEKTSLVADRIMAVELGEERA
jgi:hypothetical protein